MHQVILQYITGTKPAGIYLCIKNVNNQVIEKIFFLVYIVVAYLRSTLKANSIQQAHLSSSEEDLDPSFIRRSLCSKEFMETDNSGLATHTNRSEWLSKFCEEFGLSTDSASRICALRTLPLCITCKASGIFIQDLM
ncbi:unnamed protein product [Orchesella dallaii]|uniref:Uncharacterized protein n=1 Tax=Orchesella dallaii TaxID=48710 RepID=A0ABP1QVN9_9HEXA